VAAFLDSGGLNAGTPLATASVPVSAEQPFAKARMTRRTPRLSSGTGYGVTPVTCGVSPSMTRARPTTMVSNVQPRKMYVGQARIEPLSRMPRRFTSMTPKIDATISST